MDPTSTFAHAEQHTVYTFLWVKKWRMYVCMGGDKQWLLTGHASPEMCLFASYWDQSKTKSINRKTACITSLEPRAGRQKLGQITCSFSFPYFCIPPLFMYGVKSLSKHSCSSQPGLSLALPGCVYRGQGARASACSFSVLLRRETPTAGFSMLTRGSRARLSAVGVF